MSTGRFLAAVGAVGAALVLVASAAASRPLHGTGTSTLVNSTTLSARQADGNTILEQVNTRVDAGAFSGTVIEHQWVVIHPSGLITLHAEATLNGTYAGCGPAPVTQQIRLAGQISPAGDIRANFATVDGAPVIVQGTVSGTTASDTADFEISYHC